MNDYMSITATLHDIRKERGLTLADVSEKTGIHTSTLSQIENGKRMVSFAHLCKIADAVGAEFLVTRKNA